MLRPLSFGAAIPCNGEPPARLKTDPSCPTDVSSTRVLSITIGPPVPLVITLPEGSTCQPGTVGSSYLQNLFASGGKTPYTWLISAGSLPPGLSLVSAQNGNRITGTPTTAGTFPFTLTVRDSGGQQTSRQVSITIS